MELMKGDSLKVSDDTPMKNPQGLPLTILQNALKKVQHIVNEITNLVVWNVVDSKYRQITISNLTDFT